MDKQTAWVFYHHWNNQAGIYMRLHDANYSNPIKRAIYFRAAQEATDRSMFYYAKTY